MESQIFNPNLGYRCLEASHGRKMLRRREQNHFIWLLLGSLVFITLFWTLKSGQSTTIIRILAKDTVNPVQNGAEVDNTVTPNFEAPVSNSFGENVRVLCLVTTGPKNADKVRAVKDTWGKRCNKLVIVSSEVGNDTSLGIIPLQNVSDGRQFLWAKTKESFKYVWENHMEDADWFMKADDDTFVVVENLRNFLKEKDPMEPQYFGCKFTPDKTREYASGGGGYILSKEAVSRFILRALPNEKICRGGQSGNEDVEMGKCLRNVGVKLGDSRDEFGRHRFMPLAPDRLVPPSPPSRSVPPWYKKYMAFPQEQGPECCSSTAITFHYITINNMYVLDYFLYRLHPIGTVNTYEEIIVTGRTDSMTLATPAPQPSSSINNHPDILSIISNPSANAIQNVLKT